MNRYIINLADINSQDLPEVGGKNASLGEMIQHLSSVGVSVPGGFATTSNAFQEFLTKNDLQTKIASELDRLNVDDIAKLSLTGEKIRNWILSSELPSELHDAIKTSYQTLEKHVRPNIAVAVRSSATAEDLPEASFAGQQESYLNVCGVERGINIR